MQATAATTSDEQRTADKSNISIVVSSNC